MATIYSIRNHSAKLNKLVEKLKQNQIDGLKIDPTAQNEEFKVCITDGIGWIWFCYESKQRPYFIRYGFQDLDNIFDILEKNGFCIYIPYYDL